MDQKQTVYNFLNQFQVGVIATISPDNKPEAALIGFGQTEDLMLIFGTDITSRKYQNIQQTPHVAFVVGDNNGITVQLEGTVTELSGDEEDQLTKIYWEKVPGAKKYQKDAGNRYFKLTPTWLRYTNYTGNKENIFEISY